MIRIGILLALILAILTVRWFLKTPRETSGKQLKQIAWIAAALLLAILLLTGKLSALIALLGVLLAFIVRSMPLILNYGPQLHRIWLKFNASKQQEQGKSGGAVRTDGMTKAQALEVLGLKAGASDEEIIQAHRKLISRVHPDRGGSDYLAAQINQAKKTLLKQ